MPGLIKLLGIHGTIVFATPEKAERLMAIQGYVRHPDSVSEATTEPVTATPDKPRRGRPAKRN